MASLHSLPEHLVGIPYSLLPDRDARRALFSSTPGVRRAPSVLSQITTLSINALELALCHSVNPLACLPAGVCIKKLSMEIDGDEGHLLVLFDPKPKDVSV